MTDISGQPTQSLHRLLVMITFAAVLLLIAGCGDDSNKQQLPTPTVLGTRAPTTATPASTQKPDQIALCRATGSGAAPYEQATVDVGSDELQQYYQQPNNIIPAPPGGCPGAGTPVASSTPRSANGSDATKAARASGGTPSTPKPASTKPAGNQPKVSSTVPAVGSPSKATTPGNGSTPKPGSTPGKVGSPPAGGTPLPPHTPYPGPTQSSAPALGNISK